MGLDQFVYKLRKLSTDDLVAMENKNVEDVDYNGRLFICIPKNEIDEDPSLLTNGAADFFSEVALKEEKINYPAFFEAYGMPADSEIFAVLGNQLFIKIPDYAIEDFGASETIVELPYDELVSRFGYLEDIMFVVAENIGEIAYWRKDWDIQELVESFAPVVNCGFCGLDDAMQKAIHEADSRFEYPIECAEDEIVVYHPWW